MRTATVMAKFTKRQPKKCKWDGCTKTHYDADPDELYPLQDTGELERGKYVGQWYEPWCILLSSYKNHGVKSGRNTDDDETEISNKNHYKTENHHVITVSSMEKASVPRLKKNLKLMGWNINHGLLNGICLPENGEDYIWHNLQPHLGSHPAKYTNEVTRRLKNLNKACKPLCTKKDQDKLLEAINKEVNDLRTKILNWEIGVHTKGTLNKVKMLMAANGYDNDYGRYYEYPKNNPTIPNQSKLVKPKW